MVLGRALVSVVWSDLAAEAAGAMSYLKPSKPVMAALKSALGVQERVEEGEIDPHTPLFINITYTKKRPSFRQNSWCAKGRIVPCLGVLIRQYCRRFIPPSLYSLLGPK